MIGCSFLSFFQTGRPSLVRQLTGTEVKFSKGIKSNASSGTSDMAQNYLRHETTNEAVGEEDNVGEFDELRKS